MGFFIWIQRFFGASKPNPDLVPFYDAASKRIIRIPVKELAPGCVRARIHGIGFEEPVWVAADQLQPSPVIHPPFDEEVREYLRSRIQAVFAEHRPLSVEEWEEGFRRDAHPEPEIALWVHAGNIYTDFASNDPDPARRKHFYQVVVACLTTSRDTVRQCLPAGPLNDGEIDAVIRRFFPGRGKS